MIARRTSLVFAGVTVLLAAGCAAPTRHTCVYSGTNLALGPSVDENRMAQALSERSDWPSVSIGYRFDQPTIYFDDTFDNEYFYERDGDSYYRIRQTSQSGVLVR